MANKSTDCKRAGLALERLAVLCARLRAPDGCPWDQEQTVASSSPYLLEEAYEAVEALESGDPMAAREELGDLLFQVVFQAQLFAEENQFELADVIEHVEAKMTRRHPHVFGEATAANAEEVLALWGAIKQGELKGTEKGLLDSVPFASPSLQRAQRLGQKASRVEFDWTDADFVWEKVQEELDELRAAKDAEEAEEELGDVFFALAQWARHRKLNAEAALRRANSRFQQRFSAMEKIAAGQGLTLGEMTAEQREELWEKVKAQLQAITL